MLSRFLSRRSAGTFGRPGTQLSLEILEAREVPAVVYGLTQTNALFSFDSNNPSVILGAAAITGLQQSNERVLGIDFRPATGELYATTSTGGMFLRTYTVNPVTGVASFVGFGGASGLGNLETGYDFNPTADRIRIVQSNNENGRYNPTNGNNAGNDTDLSYIGAATGPVLAVAYDRNFARTTNALIQTTLYGIDGGSNSLVVIGSINGVPDSPNGGVVTDIGALGVTIDPNTFAGFDITPGADNNKLGTALASLTVGGVTGLYSINLTTGTATLIGNIGNGGIQFTSLTVRPPSILVVGSGPGATADVRALDPYTGAVKMMFNPFPGFTGGVRTAAGDLNGDGVPDIIASAVFPGGHIRTFDGMTGEPLPGLLGSFFPFDGFQGTVNVTAGDVNGDGFTDLIVVANGANGHVKVFSGLGGTVLSSFFAYPSYTGNVSVAAGDFNRDGRAEIVTVAAFGGHVKVFNLDGSLHINLLLGGFAYSFYTFSSANIDVNVAVGDLTGNDRADIIVATGEGSRGEVLVFNGRTGATLANFFPFPTNYRGGAFVAVADANGDGIKELRITPGTGIQADVLTFAANGVNLGITFPAFPGFAGGATIAAA